ncbi:hypothetical protein PTI98_012204 [Pleurotus ostreatus]|nr:hypothetical protein PTI98_012204 [Pleurotus ostreatus]
MARREKPALCFSNLLNKEQIDMKIQSLRLQVVQINDEIRSLEEYKNNRYLPVSKLPPEVLSTIFEFIAMTIEDDVEPYSDLLSATQVCRLWRQVALLSPRIWSFIYCSAMPRLVDLFLERSKSAPLHLLYSDDNVPENVQKVLNHLHRLKAINLQGREADWSSRIISQGAPQLESLSLRNCGEIERFHPPADGFPVLQYGPSSEAKASVKERSDRLGRDDNMARNSMPLGSCDLSRLPLTFVVRMAACITAPQLKVIDICHSGKASAEIATPIVAAIFEKLLPTFSASYSELSLCVGNFSGTRVKLWDNCVAS